MDRSHEELRALDALVASGLTYPGWEADVKVAETNHVKYPSCFDRFLAEMKKKQALQRGDRSHEQLRALDSLIGSGLCYSDWQADVDEAENYHVKYPSSFDQFLAQMKKKQAMQQGDRSHEQLRALDALMESGLTYQGWETDVKEAETNHVKYPSCFGSLLERIKKKQGMQADRSHAQLRALDELVASGLSYAGWQADLKEAESYHVQYSASFDRLFGEMKKKLSMQIGDRSHEQLRALDALVACGLTYAGWQADVKEAETNHVKHPSSFDAHLAEMRNKQLARGPAAVPRWGGGAPAAAHRQPVQRDVAPVSQQTTSPPEVVGQQVEPTERKRGADSDCVDLTGSDDGEGKVEAANKKARGGDGGGRAEPTPGEDSTECVVCLDAKKCF
eukprot:2742579-Rhodomonas_salina.1